MKFKLSASLALLIVFGLLLSGCMSSSSFENLKSANLQKVLQSGEKVTLVDIRDQDSFQRGHIEGAINIPVDKFEDRYKELNPKERVILICYTGGTSQAAAQFLLKNGFSRVANLDGGMAAWTGPVTK